MPARAIRHSPETIDFHDDDDPAFGALDAGERMCAPANLRGDSTLLPSLLVSLLLLGGGWAALHLAPDLPQRLQASVAALAPSPAGYRAPLPTPVAAVPAPPAPVVAAPPAPPPIITRDIVDAPGAAPEPAPAGDITTGALAPAPAEQADAPLPPPKVDPTDPFQKRAAGVGLHPDVSRVLLRRLTAADYRNAGEAVKTAIAKTPDDGVFVWPRQRKPADALFRVHFVPGAAPHCRRYVVTVTKDGWSTTAPPMEKCDASYAARKRS